MWTVSWAGPGRRDIAGWGLGDREERGRNLADSKQRLGAEWGGASWRNGVPGVFVLSWGVASGLGDNRTLGLEEVTSRGSCP